MKTCPARSTPRHRIVLALALTLAACAMAPDDETGIEDSKEQAAAATTTQFLWIPATSATAVHGATAAIGGSAGLFGTSGVVSDALFPVLLPVGSRITKLGVRFRHGSGESTGGDGAVVLAGIYRSGGAVQGNANVELVPASPPASNPSYTLTVPGAASATWDEKIVTIDTTRNQISGSFTYAIGVIFSGPIQLEAIGYEWTAK